MLILNRMKMYMSQTSLANRYKIVKKCIQKKIKAGASDQNSNADFFKKQCFYKWTIVQLLKNAIDAILAAS